MMTSEMLYRNHWATWTEMVEWMQSHSVTNVPILLPSTNVLIIFLYPRQTRRLIFACSSMEINKNIFIRCNKEVHCADDEAKKQKLCPRQVIMQCILYHYIHVLCMLWLVSYCIICIKLCNLWCRSTFFVVLFYRRNRKWLLYVYITWCKQLSENMKVLNVNT